jgi:hypothetical protein
MNNLAKFSGLAWLFGATVATVTCDDDTNDPIPNCSTLARLESKVRQKRWNRTLFEHAYPILEGNGKGPEFVCVDDQSSRYVQWSL